MPSLSTALKLFLALLVASRVKCSPTFQEETDTSKSESPSIVARKDTIETLPHDAVVAMEEHIPDNMDGTLYRTYQPYLYVRLGCVPFPAVDEQGRIGRGLKASGPTGFKGSKCGWTPKGQVYVRSAPVGKYFGLLFIWYQPKDQTDVAPPGGSRHDWDGALILLKDRNKTDAANIFAICPSRSGWWTCQTDFTLQGTSPLIEYTAHGSGDHTCYVGNRVGTQQPMVAWESMPKAAAYSLSNYDYGKPVPFIDAYFNATLAKIVPPVKIVKTLPHDRVVPMSQLTPAGTNGTSYLKYQPRLTVSHGCVPFPAVDAQGNVGRGLKPTGPSGGRHSKCHKSDGQVYVRAAQVGKHFALLYAWYQPKDQRGKHGKRNDWEGVVLYLKNRSGTDATNIHAVCPSAQGTWACSTKFSVDGTFPLIEYTIHGSSKDNTCYLSEKVGDQYALVAWESMPGAAAEALALYDFGASKVPFIDEHFNATLALAVPPP